MWQLNNCTEDELFNLPVDKLMKVIIDISPDVNKAYTDFLRACNEGWYYEIESMHGKPIIDDFIALIETNHHDFDVLIDQVYAGISLRGGLFIELVLNEATDMATNIAVLQFSPDMYPSLYRAVLKGIVGFLQRQQSMQLMRWQTQLPAIRFHQLF